MTQKEIILMINKLNEGNTNELITLIGEEKFNGLCLTGVINNHGDIWEITNQGKRLMVFYKEPSFKEKLMGIYCNYMLGF